MKHHNIASVAILLVVLFTTTVLAKDKYSDKEKYSDKNKIVIKEKDMMRKSIVFDKKTPNVFYCPMQKPSGLNKLIVRSRPLYKLCEFEGLPLPEDYKSDCYDDVDESDYACKEKYRIMMRLHPPGSDTPYNGARLLKFLEFDNEIRHKMTLT